MFNKRPIPITANIFSSSDFYRKMQKQRSSEGFLPISAKQQRRAEAFKLKDDERCERFGFNTDSSDDGSVEDDATDDFIYKTYMSSLKTRAKAVTEYCLMAEQYKPWRDHWKFLEKNLLSKNKLNFSLLQKSDQDIAYVINKGDEIHFRLHDKQRFVPLNIYQYVLYHEMAHMSTRELQHTPEFHVMLNLLSLAAYELGFIDLRTQYRSYYKTNGQAITSAESLQDEIILGCNHMINTHKNNPKLVKAYTDLRQHVAKRV